MREGILRICCLTMTTRKSRSDTFPAVALGNGFSGGSIFWIPCRQAVSDPI